MTTQTKLSNPIEAGQAPIIKQQFSLPLALAILVLGFMVGVFATKLSSAENTYEVNGQRAIEAEAARYTSLGLFYAAGNEAKIQRAIEAEAARYKGLATLYTGEDEMSGQPGLEAEAARYNGLVDFYGAENGSSTLAWPPRPTQFHIAENAVMPIAEDALAEYHQSEWDRAPSTVLLADDALAAYHQSEWGRSLSTVLPIAKNEVNDDRDIGLMEFFTVVNEAGLQRHDREYGLAAFSTVSEADADQDIGLMEFSTAGK